MYFLDQTIDVLLRKVLPGLAFVGFFFIAFIFVVSILMFAPRPTRLRRQTAADSSCRVSLPFLLYASAVLPDIPRPFLHPFYARRLISRLCHAGQGMQKAAPCLVRPFAVICIFLYSARYFLVYSVVSICTLPCPQFQNQRRIRTSCYVIPQTIRLDPGRPRENHSVSHNLKTLRS